MKKFIPFAVLFCLVLSNAIAQDQNAVTRIEPPNWWTGMKEPFVQVLVHGYGIGEYHVSVKYPGVELLGTDRAESPNYLFINLSIDPSTRPGTVEIRFTHKDKKTFSYPFPLLARAGGSANRTGVGYSDVIYLLMPDRFANGDTTNDDMPGMTEKMNRINPDGRHGGDIRGIRDHLHMDQSTARE